MSKAIENLNKAMERAAAIRPGGFPDLAESLRLAGVNRNTWSLPACQSIFLTSFGPVVMQGAPLLTGTADVPTFNQDALTWPAKLTEALFARLRPPITTALRMIYPPSGDQRFLETKPLS